MAQTVGGKTISFIRSVAAGTDATSIAAVELDHATKLSAEIVAMSNVNPDYIQSTVGRTHQGEYELLSVLAWV